MKPIVTTMSAAECSDATVTLNVCEPVTSAATVSITDANGYTPFCTSNDYTAEQYATIVKTEAIAEEIDFSKDIFGRSSIFTQTEISLEQFSHMENIYETFYSTLWPKNEMKRGIYLGIADLHLNDDKVKFYTGLPNYKILEDLFYFVKDRVLIGKKLSQFEEFMLTLMKLRLNTCLQDLAYRADISVAATCLIIDKWLIALDEYITSDCIKWPDRDVLQKTMPVTFQKAFGGKVTVTIDCLKIFFERPPNLLTGVDTTAQYKHRCLVKYYFGITHNGIIVSITRMDGDIVSDMCFLEHSKLFRNMARGDILLADRQLTLSPRVGTTDDSAVISVFTKVENQLMPVDVKNSRTLSDVRIHVEQVIGQVKQKYKILSGFLPTDFVSVKTHETMLIVDCVVRVCCSLCNMSQSVVSVL